MVADFFTYFNIILSFLWTFKVQILGGFFAALTLFEYFYRYKLAKRRNKQKDEIKQIITESLKIRIMGNNLDTNDIEHEMIKQMVESLEIKLDISNRATRTQISSEFEVVNIRLDNIDEKSTTALAKIAVLEKDIDFIRAFKKYKNVFFLALLGLVSATNFEQIKIWLTKLNPFK